MRIFQNIARAGVLGATALLLACGGGGGGAPGTAAATRVAVQVSVVGQGRITASAPTLDCTALCSAEATQGSDVVLTAVPQTGHMVSAWSGACSGASTHCTVRASASFSATATFVPIPSASAWSAEQTLSGAGAGSAKVAMDSAGRAVVVWRQLDGATSNNSLWANRFEPGSGWGSPTLLESSAGDVAAPLELAMERSTGRAVVAWRQLGATGYDLWAKTWDPLSGWSSTQALESASGTVGVVAVGIDSAGAASAVWSQIGPGSRYSIYASRMALGAGWSTPQLLETHEVVGEIDGDPELAVAPNGNAVAVWKRSTGVAAALWANQYTNASGWGTATEVVADTGSAMSIGAHALAVDAAGTTTLVWGQITFAAGNWTNALWFRRHSAGAWQGAAALVAPGTASASGFISSPALVQNSGGTTVASWALPDGTLYSALAAPGSAFGTRSTLRGPATSTPNTLPALGVDDQNSAMAAWTESDGNAYLATRSGGTWNAPAVHENRSDTASDPSLSMNDLGNAVMVWTQYVSGLGTQIMARTYRSGR